MIEFLTTYFHPKTENFHSLEIKYGMKGSKLANDHSTQFTFVLQSLLLWREIMNEMFRLWFMTEKDLLDERNKYRLMQTGQGLNRVQSAPNIGSTMSGILGRVQSSVKSWVGLSVVHLGDRDVPNALVFIDKYTQVPRILAPIVKTIDGIDNLYKDSSLKRLITDQYGGPENLKKDILSDYFKHGFDGSGSDGGSCIDGRLTSSWNWCSKIEKKDYYQIFLLSGFTGFDGDYRAN